VILGMSTSTFTFVHLVLSLAAIGSGFFLVWGLLHNRRLDGWTAIFIVTSMLTSLTGFVFPFVQLRPSHVLGLSSLTMLTLAIFARIGFQLEGAWRRIYVVSISAALYFNCFAAVVQAFAKIPVLRGSPPSRSQPLFLIAQGSVLAVFVILTFLAAKRFRVSPVSSA